MKSCSWCDNAFIATVSYQIYCSVDCRNNATKEKIVERHRILRRQKRVSKVRMCAGGCGQKLSVYNENSLCNLCAINEKEVIKKMKEIKKLMHEYEERNE